MSRKSDRVRNVPARARRDDTTSNGPALFILVITLFVVWFLS